MNPVLQVIAQPPAPQLVVPFATVGQAVHDVVPHELTLPLLEHLVPQT
jgi:hypothetical protein